MAQDPLIGAHLGNYHIEKPLGRGGMAQVYKAQDTTLKRNVAIKVIKTDLSAQEKYLGRFEREAQAIAALEHPHIIPVYYFGQAQGIYYLAMKFVEGEDLSTLMARYGRNGEYLPIEDILRIMDAVTGALDYAHGHGVIHRDVKPGNVMIDRDGYPYLTDFGLALNMGQGTMGEVFGSPHYISPEQARNSAEAVPQSDFYSLGVMLYEMFTGAVPFDDPNPMTIALHHMMDEPPSPRHYNPGISSYVEGVILKALSKRIDDRYRNGHEMAIALREALQKSVGRRESAVEIPSLPPLPPGAMLPPSPQPLRPSILPIAQQVRASLSEKPTSASMPTPLQSPVPVSPIRQPIPPGANQPPEQTGLTRMRPPSSNRLPLIVLSVVIVAVLLIVGITAVVLSSSKNATPTAPAAVSPAVVGSAPTATPLAPTTVVIASTAAPLPATDTSAPPSATSIPPTDTVAPASATPVPPTDAAISPTASTSVQATPFPADWTPVRFVYDADTFVMYNLGDQRLPAANISFQRVGGSDKYDGGRWTRFYGYVDPGNCAKLTRYTVVISPAVPANCSRMNSSISGNSRETFWTNSGQFAVTWGGNEVAMCEISAGTCDAAVPG